MCQHYRLIKHCKQIIRAKVPSERYSQGKVLERLQIGGVECFCDGTLPFSPPEVVWSLQDPGAKVREGGGQAAWKGGDGQGGY